MWQICISQALGVKPYAIPTKRGRVVTDICPTCKERYKAVSESGVKQPYCLQCYRVHTKDCRIKVKQRKQDEQGNSANTSSRISRFSIDSKRNTPLVIGGSNETTTN